MIADALRRLSGLRLRDLDGNEEMLELQPPATDVEVRALEARLPCPIPGDIRDALRVSKGLVNGPLESFSLVDLEGFGLEELLPCAYSIAHDGFGNYWVLDLLPDTTTWGPVFYVCHDPPVLAYQSPTIEQFLSDAIAMWQDAVRSSVELIHEDVVNQIWRDSPGVMTPAALHDSADRHATSVCDVTSADSPRGRPSASGARSGLRLGPLRPADDHSTRRPGPCLGTHSSRA